MGKLWTYQIDVDNGEIESNECEDSMFNEDDYDGSGYATYDEDGFDGVYAESLVSAEHAEGLVYEKCLELRDKFQKCVDKILHGDTHESLH